MARSEIFLSRKFDFLYRLASSVMEKFNPCRIENGSCYSMRAHPGRHLNDPFCCKGCKYLKADGCSVQSLYCKLWICGPLTEVNRARQGGRWEYSPMAERMERIKRIASKYDLLVFRGSKEDSLRQALSGRIRIGNILKIYG